MKSCCIELMQIIQIISAITSSEDIDFIFVAISCMHIAWTWWLASEFTVEPSELLQVQNVHIVGCERTLSKPTTDDV